LKASGIEVPQELRAQKSRPGMVTRLAQRFDLPSWDVWVPLAVIFAFGIMGLLVLSGAIRLNLPARDLERVHILYTEIGIQTTAGVFAIIMSLSLVAIQFAAQEYSHRIMDYYLKSAIFWVTMGFYLGLMILTIVLQAIATEGENVRVVSVIVLGAITALVLLIPHFVITAAYLRPEFILSKLLRRVDREYLMAIDRVYLGRTTSVPSRADRLLPAIEITERSIDRGDLTTVRASIDLLSEMYNEHAQTLKRATIERYFMNHFLRIGRKAISESDEDQAGVLVIQLIGTIGTTGPAAMAVENIDILGIAALKKDSDPVVRQMIESLDQIYTAVDSHEIKMTILGEYDELAGSLAAADKDRLIQQLAETLFRMAQKAQSGGEAGLFEKILDIIETAGHAAATKGIYRVVLYIARSAQTLGVSIAPQDSRNADRLVRILLRLERAVNSNEREVISALEFASKAIQRAIPKAPARPAQETPLPPPAAAPQAPAPQAAPIATQQGGPPPQEGQSKRDEQPAAAKSGDEGGLDLSDLWGKAE
jgi:hypothetical protein